MHKMEVLMVINSQKLTILLLSLGCSLPLLGMESSSEEYNTTVIPASNIRNSLQPVQPTNNESQKKPTPPKEPEITGIKGKQEIAKDGVTSSRSLPFAILQLPKDMQREITALMTKDLSLIDHLVATTIELDNEYTSPMATLAAPGTSSIFNHIIVNNLLIHGCGNHLFTVWDLNTIRLDNAQLPATQPFISNNCQAFVRGFATYKNFLLYGKRNSIAVIDQNLISGSTLPTEQIITFPGQKSIESLIVKDDLLIALFENFTIKTWNINTKDNHITLNDQATIIAYTGHESFCKSIKVIDNKIILAIASLPLKIWDLHVQGTVTDPLVEFNISTNGLLNGNSFDLANNLLVSTNNNTINIWKTNLENKSIEHIATLNGHADFITSVIIKENLIITGSHDKTIKIWDLNSRGIINAPIATLKGHQEQIHSLIVHNNVLSSSSVDRSIRLWDISSLITQRKKLSDFLTNNLTFLQARLLLKINMVYEQSSPELTKVPLSKLELKIMQSLLEIINKQFGFFIASRIKERLGQYITKPEELNSLIKHKNWQRDASCTLV